MPTSTPTRPRSNLLVLVLGAAIVAGFFGTWIDVFFTISGWTLAKAQWSLFLVPLGGLALIGTAVAAPRLVPAAALAIGGALTAWFAWNIARVSAHVYGWGITMVVAGSVFAVAGSLIKRPWLTGVGGLAMIAGFFAPWIEHGHISGFQLARANGMGAIAIAAWLVPVGGVLAAYASTHGERGRGLGAFGGMVGLGAVAYLTYRLLGELQAFMGWGYFVVIGAGVVALIVGVRLRRQPRAIRV